MQIVQTDYKHTLPSIAYRLVTAKKTKQKKGIIEINDYI